MRTHPSTSPKLRPYGDRSGRSGVIAYACSQGQITVKFRRSADLYLYTAEELGEETIHHMSQLAQSGKGLSTFISQHVKDRYTAKLD